MRLVSVTERVLPKIWNLMGLNGEESKWGNSELSINESLEISFLGLKILQDYLSAISIG